jgi:uncharacterized protein (DUF2062 family)/trans-aconitate methyltransferase
VSAAEGSAAPAAAEAPPRRERPGRAFAELVYRLRTEGGSPARQAWAVAAGVFIGCLPLYGLHLALCLAAGRLFGFNRIKAYLAAQLNNPLTAPFLVAAEIGAGRLLRGGSLAGLAPARLAERGAAGVGLDLALGSLAVGTVLGAALGAATWLTLRGRRRPAAVEALIEAAARPYLAAGVFHWEMVRGKLRYDPVYLDLLRWGALPDGGQLLDLGCGRGILFGLVAAARTAAARGELPAGWPDPPMNATLHGIEARPRIAAAAAAALAGAATIEAADLTAAPLPPARAVLLLDVLHYLPAAAQERLLARAAACLEPRGVLLMREADAAGGARFLATRAAERLCALARGHLRQRFRYRAAAEWRALLAAQGLAVAPASPLSAGAYANVLLEARKPDRAPS